MRQKWTVIVGLVAITVGHLVYRQVREGGNTEVSTRAAPFTIGELGLQGVGEESDWEACQILVFFRPTPREGRGTCGG